MSDAKVTTMKSSHTKEIPIRRVLLSDPSQLPSDYSQTPGGTLFSTTPGGDASPAESESPLSDNTADHNQPFNINKQTRPQVHWVIANSVCKHLIT